jgi:hypothetical protein
MHNRHARLKTLQAARKFSSLAWKHQRSSWSDLGHAAIDEELDTST